MEVGGRMKAPRDLRIKRNGRLRPKAAELARRLPAHRSVLLGRSRAFRPLPPSRFALLGNQRASLDPVRQTEPGVWLPSGDKKTIALATRRREPAKKSAG